MSKFLGRDEIKEIQETDLKTPLGEPVSKVLYLNEVDILEKEIKFADSILEEYRAERGELKSDTDRAKELDKMIENQEKAVGDLTDEEAPVPVERSIYASKRTLDNCQTDEPSDKYYHNRKLKVSEAILGVMAEWNVQDIEVGQILQNVQQSYQENILQAMGGAFGKKQMDLNMLDYHYAITKDRKDN